MEINTIEDLHNAINEGYYNVEYMKPQYIPEDTILDEEKSVKWNREQVEKRNLDQQEKYESKKTQNSNMHDTQVGDIVRVYSEYSGFSKDRIEKIFHHAYKKQHSYGIYDVIQELEEILDLLDELDIEK